MRVVVALGGNALLRRGQPMTAENQRENVGLACDHLAPIAEKHELIISHGNGPQIGLLALEEAAYGEATASPLDVLGAETQGMIGYLIEQELGNRLPFSKPLASLLTMIEVDPDDPAFADPSKPIGPLYDQAEADKLAAERGWVFKPDGDSLRRVVPSPVPKRIFELRPIRWLLDQGCVVICAGGGGIPVAYRPGRQLTGRGGSDRQGPGQRAAGPRRRRRPPDHGHRRHGRLHRIRHPAAADHRRGESDALLTEYEAEFAAGSMLPKVIAASDFAQATGKPAAIGALADIDAMLDGTAGTRITTSVAGVEFANSPA